MSSKTVAGKITYHQAKMSDKEYDDPDYDDLDALLEDNSTSDSGNVPVSEVIAESKNVNFNDAIDNTMSRLTNLKLNDNKSKTGGNSFLGGDGDGFGMLDELVKMMQGKDILYSNLLNFRNELKQWIEENPNSEIITDRKLQLENCNKRISIYESADYTDEKYSVELKDLTTAFLDIPNQFGGLVGENSDDMTNKITQEFLTKDMMYDSTVSYRNELKQWLDENKTGGEAKLKESRQKELEIYDKIIAIFDSKDYSPDNENISEEIFDLLEQTKDLYEPQPLGGDKMGGDNSDLQNELLKALDDIAGTAMDCFNTSDENMDPTTKAEQEKLLKELEQGCPQQ